MSEALREAAAAAARSPVFARLVSLLEQGDRRPGLLRVLTYHRVDDPDARPELSPTLISATPAEFADQMEFLAASCRPVSLAEVLVAFETREPLPPRSVLVTFDDAYVDFAEHAWPVLRRCGIPAVLFVPTWFPDQPQRGFWWDRLYHAVTKSRGGVLMTPVGRLSLEDIPGRRNAYARLNEHLKMLPHEEALAAVQRICDQLGSPSLPNCVLGWDDLRRLAAEGVALGAHTRTHPLMDRVSREEARAEAAGSLRDLRREIGDVLPAFAYPSGSLTAEVVRDLAEEGFGLAFTTSHGINDVRRADRMRLKRINVSRRSSLPVLRARMLPWWAGLRRRSPLAVR